MHSRYRIECNNRRASMRPRPRGRGNEFGAARRGLRRRCFNEATATRPWKYYKWARTANAGRGFNEATATRPWKYFVLPVPTPASKCFNEATATRPWKSRWRFPDSRRHPASMRPRPRGRGNIRAVFAPLVGRPASMRPRPRGRGNSMAQAGVPHSLARFNEATATRPWKSATSYPETASLRASMRPRPRGRGNGQAHS